MFSEAPKSIRQQPAGEHHTFEEHESGSPFVTRAHQEAIERHEREISVLKNNTREVEEWERMSTFERFVMIHERPSIQESLEDMYKRLRHLEEDHPEFK